MRYGRMNSRIPPTGHRESANLNPVRSDWILRTRKNLACEPLRRSRIAGTSDGRTRQDARFARRDQYLGRVRWDASKPAIVFIHGLSCTALGWDKQFADPELYSNFHLVRYEMRGHGRSGKPLEEAGYESAKFAADFRTVCEAYGVVRPFVVGWSLGGSTVVDIVTAYGPDYISGLIYVGGPILALHYHAVCRHPVMTEMFPLITSLASDDMSGGAEAFVDSCVKEPLPYDVKLLFMGGYIMQPRVARFWSLKRIQDHAVWERTARRIPVLIVQGKEDLHCLYETMIGIAKRIYDDVEVRLMEGIGHSPHFESAATTNRFIVDWVSSVVNRNTSNL